MLDVNILILMREHDVKMEAEIFEGFIILGLRWRKRGLH